MENKEISFEENLEKLEKIVKELENGDVPLNDAINKFNEGMKLASECDKILSEANEAVVKVLDKNGNLETTKFDKEEM